MTRGLKTGDYVKILGGYQPHGESGVYHYGVLCEQDQNREWPVALVNDGDREAQSTCCTATISSSKLRRIK